MDQKTGRLEGKVKHQQEKAANKWWSYFSDRDEYHE